MIGKKIYKKKFTTKEYANAAKWCNANNAHIEEKENYYIIVENMLNKPTIKEQIIALEQKYNMCRWQRELILADDSKASDFIKQRAQEIEDLAEQVRK